MSEQDEVTSAPAPTEQPAVPPAGDGGGDEKGPVAEAVAADGPDNGPGDDQPALVPAPAPKVNAWAKPLTKTAKPAVS